MTQRDCLHHRFWLGSDPQMPRGDHGDNSGAHHRAWTGAGELGPELRLVFAVVFCVTGCWPLVHGEPLRWWALVVAAVFAALALVRPQLFHLLNRLWLAFGAAPAQDREPLVMGMLFFVAVTPPLAPCACAAATPVAQAASRLKSYGSGANRGRTRARDDEAAILSPPNRHHNPSCDRDSQSS